MQATARRVAAVIALAAVSSQACEDVPDRLAFGFYAYFAPVSHSADSEIGNRDATFAHRGLVVGALDAEVEWGGFTVDAGATALLACLDRRINYLTDDRRIGYAAWREDPTVFLRRAWRWTSEASSRRGFFRGWRLWLIDD